MFKKRTNKKRTNKQSQSFRIIPLGGLGEVGRNMFLVEYQRKILIVDVGLRMPEEDMPGIDYIIPDISYLEGKEKQIVGIVFTHGHYDHIGAVPYLMPKLGYSIPMFTGALTRGIILKRQGEFPGQPRLKIKTVRDGAKIRLKPFEVEFVKLNHNVPDNFGLLIKTPVGNIFYTSDFKFDSKPIYDKPVDFSRLQKIGQKGILLLMCDSTGAEEEGHSLSEEEIMENLEKIFQRAQGRIFASTFASLLNRIQQIIALSEKYGRKVAIEGYSLKTNLRLARQLRYLKAKHDTFIETKEIKDHPDSRVTILCTGAQGEGGAVLMKVTSGAHRLLKFKKGDSVIFSSSVIPGNERAVQNLKDNILRQGTKVFHYRMMDIHAGGHAQKEELKKMIKIMSPKFFMPVHGQYSMLVANRELARKVGIPSSNTVLIENGEPVRLTGKRIFIEKPEASSDYVMVDGLGIGDVGEVVLRDRKALAEDGMFVIIAIVDRKNGQIRSSPDIISRGFVYLKESKTLLAETRKKVADIVNQGSGQGSVNVMYLKNEIRDKIGNFLYTKTKRRPMVLPVVIEV